MATNLNDFQSKRALVLGGGGPVGRAWQSGLASSLVANGVALGSADLILGTSAGAIVGAQLALGLDLANAGPPFGAAGPAPASQSAMGELSRALAHASQVSAPELVRQVIGKLALEAVTPSEDQSIQRVAFLAGNDWPANFCATAVDVDTGKHVVWNWLSDAPLEQAVASSCALPGVWPPITIKNARYMDGGMRSVLNADLALGYGVVIIVSCFPLVLPESIASEEQRALNASLLSEIDSLRTTGAFVETILPNNDFLTLTQGGTKMLDGSLAPAAFKIGVQQGNLEASRLDDRWNLRR